MTPLYIEVALHYHCKADEFPRLHAPAVQDVIREFLLQGLLDCITGPGPRDRMYKPTEGMRVLVDALCATPFPVKKWVMP